MLDKNTVLRMSEVEVAYQILKGKGQPMNYRDLIESVLVYKPKNGGDPIRALSSIYTQMNLDTRFVHLGNGQWGIKSWMPSRSGRRVPTISLLNKTIDYDDSKDLDEDFDGALGYERDDWDSND